MPKTLSLQKLLKRKLKSLDKFRRSKFSIKEVEKKKMTTSHLMTENLGKTLCEQRLYTKAILHTEALKKAIRKTRRI